MINALQEQVRFLKGSIQLQHVSILITLCPSYVQLIKVIFKLYSDVVVRRDPLKFSIALPRQQKCTKRLSNSNYQTQCSRVRIRLILCNGDDTDLQYFYGTDIHVSTEVMSCNDAMARRDPILQSPAYCCASKHGLKDCPGPRYHIHQLQHS